MCCGALQLRIGERNFVYARFTPTIEEYTSEKKTALSTAFVSTFWSTAKTLAGVPPDATAAIVKSGAYEA
jgi:hypothetical protein